MPNRHAKVSFGANVSDCFRPFSNKSTEQGQHDGLKVLGSVGDGGRVGGADKPPG